jgi:hypothetical protein
MLYISGPMTGLPGCNYAAFNDAAKRLRAGGWNVVNPAEHFDGRTDLPRHMYLALDVADLIERCRSIVFLAGWQQSEGARLEAQIAVNRGYRCYLWSGIEPVPVRRDEVERFMA